MSVTTTELLRFILSLLGDQAKADEFMANPSEAMASAGLASVTCADVDAITPVIANASQGAVAIVSAGTPGEMIQHIIKNVAVSNTTYDNSGVIQNVWSSGELNQAFAGDGGLALSGDLTTDAPVITGDGNIVATDTAQASGRDTIQNQADGNLNLGGDQTIAQDEGVVAGGDAIAQGDKVGGNQYNAENTGNDNSVSIGGNQNNAENTGNTTVHDQSTTIGGNQNNAENTGNTTLHDQSTTIGDISVDLSDRSDNSVSVGGNQNNAENTGNDNSVNVGDVSVDLSDRSDNSTTIGDVDLSDRSDNSITVGDVTVDLSEDNSVGGDYWAEGSNVGGIGNTDSRNSGNVNDSGNTLAISETHDDSINVGTVAIDLSNTLNNTTNEDNSVNVGAVDLSQDNSVNVGDVTTTLTDDNSVTVGDVDLSEDNSVTVGDVDLSTDNSLTVGDIDLSTDNSIGVGDVAVDASTNAYVYEDSSSTAGDTYTYTDESTSYGDYYEQGSGNTASIDATVAVDNSVDLSYEYNFGS